MKGRVIEISRFPVKSMLGESLSSVLVNERGLAGDRMWALKNPLEKFGSGKTTRRFQRIDGLFRFQARYDDSLPIVTMPDGTEFCADDPAIHTALSEYLDTPVTLSKEEAVSHFDQSPISLITTSSICALSELIGEKVDARRFRANLLLDVDEGGFAEDEWINRRIQVGPDVVLKVIKPIQRCVMINFAQEDLPSDNRILRTVAKEHDANFGIYAYVEKGGIIEKGQSADCQDD